MSALDAIGRRLICTLRAFCGSQDASPAIGDAERLRLRCIADALVAHYFGLSVDDFAHVLAECDFAASALTDEFASTLNAKGFWRVDRDKDPELRQTVLAYVAFWDLKAGGVEAFFAQNDGAGWMIPERLRLADYGLGRDERALVAQPVASRLVDTDVAV
ncbi:hypothetical protein [Candidatus Burkholderia verschuerenii]|uniref:hypothetical protein n=1 Tax=Candidatus Burkholderia verschuerenii TaxID=242163 RepID=UPI000B0B403A|nr:hypothetical protein [Candidatus Burkholderia verschuerenii]